MKNKVLIKLLIPEIDEVYDIYIPVNKRIGSTILLINKAVSEISSGQYLCSDEYSLYNRETGDKYDAKLVVRDTDIKNGTNLILI